MLLRKRPSHWLTHPKFFHYLLRESSPVALKPFDHALGSEVHSSGWRDVDLIALDAFASLSQMDRQQGRIVELRFFSGLSIESTAKILGISAATVKRDWNLARAWLHRELRKGNTPNGT